MRPASIALIIFVFTLPLHGTAQSSPAELLRSALDSLTEKALSQIDSTLQMERIFPAVSSELPGEQVRPITDLWRRSLNAAGKEVYLTQQPGTYRVELRVETYAIHMTTEKSGWFGKRNLHGVLNLAGDILVADTAGKVIQTVPLKISNPFEVTGKQDVWHADETLQHYPIYFSNMQDHPEIRTILLAVTSAMIIYLFYSMRG